MKRFTYITAILATAIAISVVSCDSKRQPGKIYMPDMTYSRAYESYAERDTAEFTMDINGKGGKMIFYNAMPVHGTIKRGELFPFPLEKDTNNYKIAGMVKNPFDSLSKADMAEAGRLFNINCGVCHGEKAGGNGPISGKIGAVANLTLPDYVKMPDGQMFYSITYGKNNMGSYASQLTRAQRWSIIKYIRTLQPKAEAAAPAATTTAPVAKTDTTAKKG